MSKVFISYNTENRDAAAGVRAALALARFDVFWDEDLQTGCNWSAELDAALQSAGCVVVLWSQNAVKSEWVQQEAAVAKALGKLVPARLETCEVPEPYKPLQTADLTDWVSEEGKHLDDYVEFRDLVTSIRNCVKRTESVQRRRRWAIPIATTAALIFLLVGYMAARVSSGGFLQSECPPPTDTAPSQMDVQEYRTAVESLDICMEQEGRFACEAPARDLRRACRRFAPE